MAKKQVKNVNTKTLPKFDVHALLIGLSFVPLVFAAFFQGGYFLWETYLTFLLAIPPIFLFIYLKFVKGEPFITNRSELPMFLFLLVAFVSLFFTVYFFATLTEFYKVALYVMLFYIVLNSVTKDTLFEISIDVILVLSFALSVLGLLAFFQQRFNLQGAFFTYLKDFGLMEGSAVSSTLQYSNTFGAFLILPIFLSFSKLLKENSLYKKVIYIVLTLVFLVTFLLTQSRGSLITFFIALILFLTLLRKRELKISFYYFAVVLVVLVSVFFIKKDFFLQNFNALIFKIKDLLLFLKGEGSKWSSLGTRLYMIKDSLNILKDYPIFGTGSGTYQYVYAKYRSIYFFSKFPHSIFFQILDEQGIVGGVVFLFLIGFLFVKGLKIVKGHYSPLLSGLFAGIVGVLLHALIDFDWSLMFMPMLFFFVFGLVFSKGEKTTFDFRSPIREFFKKEVLAKETKIKKSELVFINRTIILGISFMVLLLMLLFSFLSANLDRIATSKIGRAYPSEVISLYKNAIAFNPLDAKPHYDLAHYYTSVVMPNVNNPSSYVNDAVSEYKAAIQRCPTFFIYHYELGKLYLQIGDKNSISEFKESVMLNPLDPGAHSSLALAYLTIEKNTNMAKFELDKAFSLGQSIIAQGYANKSMLADTYFVYGSLYEELKDYDNAIKNYNLAIEADGKNAIAYFRLGMVYKAKGMLQEAVRNLFFAVKYNPALKEAKTEFEKYAPILTIVNPQDGMVFKEGDVIKIQWVPSNFNNTESYAIYLYGKDGSKLIASLLDPKTLSYDYKIEGLSLGTYTLRVYAVSPKFMQGKFGNVLSYAEVKITIQK